MEHEEAFPPLPAALEAAWNTPGADDPAESWRKIEQAWAEVRHRDSTAEERVWHWQRMTSICLALMVAAVSVCLYLILTTRHIQTLVQVVRQEANGPLVQVGVPQDLLTYTPEEGAWRDMLTAWVQKLRWRSAEQPVMQAHWAWVYRHTCTTARRVLQQLEATEKPFASQKKLVTVTITSILKTLTPDSYQVLFTERTTDMTAPQVDEKPWTATLAVGRLRPATLTDALENHLGLCVTGFDFAPILSK